MYIVYDLFVGSVSISNTIVLFYQMGSVYTLYVAGERLTFLMDTEVFHHFFQSTNVDFQKAVQNPVQNVG